MFNSEYTSGNGLKTSISTLRFTKVLPSYSKHIFLLNMKNIMKVCFTTYLDTGYMDYIMVIWTVAAFKQNGDMMDWLK